MGNNISTTDVEVCDVAGHSLFREYWHYSTMPTPVSVHEYTKTLMNLAGADGILADEERQWILGNVAAKGASKEMYDYFKI
ncbi:unnamed protein product [Adineta steineri]|uniref:Uncharacterized protein n=1 Tax=Adineta steineri TaxID=433720 RepID=A0A814QNP1_9BILA|nr:unnamed protein product [Adineta steineri]CAF3841463.1 unnamed protein product [Adineta steineri]